MIFFRLGFFFCKLCYMWVCLGSEARKVSRGLFVVLRDMIIYMHHAFLVVFLFVLHDVF